MQSGSRHFLFHTRTVVLTTATPRQLWPQNSFVSDEVDVLYILSIFVSIIIGTSYFQFRTKHWHFDHCFGVSKTMCRYYPHIPVKLDCSSSHAYWDEVLQLNTLPAHNCHLRLTPNNGTYHVALLFSIDKQHCSYRNTVVNPGTL